MEVLPITPRGFCHGVIRAIQIAKKAAIDPAVPKPVYILGMIVHNQHVVDDLSLLSAITLYSESGDYSDKIDTIDSGTVVITAHGIPENVIQKALSKGLNVIDATCPFVSKSKKRIIAKLSQGYKIVYIGKKGHPESRSALSLSPNIILLETEDDVLLIPKNWEKIYVTTQTTCSKYDVYKIMEKIKNTFSNAIFENEICDATRKRQEALIKANKNVDLCVVVGDFASNNTKNLAKTSSEMTKTRTILVNSVSDIKEYDFSKINRVSVTSGASTPDEVTEAVISFLCSYPSSE